MLSHKNGMR